MTYDDLMSINVPSYYWYLDNATATYDGLVLTFRRLTYGQRGIIPKKDTESWFDIFNSKHRVVLAEIRVFFEDVTSYS